MQGRSHDGMEAPGRGPADSPLGGPADVQHFNIVGGNERSQRREGDSPTRTAQQRRKKDQRRALGIKEGLCPEAVWVSKDPSKLSLTDKKAVQECTSKYYNKTFDELMDFCVTEGLPTETNAQLDLAGDDFMDFMFLEGARSDIGEKLIAALKFIRPSLEIALRRSLARLRRAVTGFRKAAPPRSRVPLPWEWATGMAALMHRKGHKSRALALVLGFDTYARPSSLLQLQVQDVLPPVAALGLNCWALLLDPQEQGQTSKTGRHGGDLLLRDESCPLLGGADRMKGSQRVVVSARRNVLQATLPGRCPRGRLIRPDMEGPPETSC